MGVSVENEKYTFRIDHLRKAPVSDPIYLNRAIAWANPSAQSGGNSLDYCGWRVGSGTRPMNDEWVIESVTSVVRQSLPFFFKQWVSKPHKERAFAGKS